MIRTCDSDGCNVLTLGSYCLACEEKAAKVSRTFPRGRPFVRPVPIDADHVEGDEGGLSPQLPSGTAR